MQSGEAILTSVDDSTTRVELTIGAGGNTPQPAHIHRGSCANLDPQPAYALDDVVGGESSTSVNVSLDELRDGEFAVNVHKSAAEAQIYVACGDIGSAAGGTTTETGEEDSGYGVLATPASRNARFSRSISRAITSRWIWFVPS